MYTLANISHLVSVKESVLTLSLPMFINNVVNIFITKSSNCFQHHNVIHCSISVLIINVIMLHSFC